MEYTIQALARLSGVTSRTLRWYDSIGLLRPERVTQAGYRIYGPEQVDRLQQILFFRELGMPLKDIGAILDDPQFDRQAALQSHLAELGRERERLDRLIAAVEQTLLDAKGEITMTDKEKFTAFQRKAVEENEEKYGKEIRGKYGDKAVDESNRAFLSMSQEENKMWKALDEEIRTALEKAVAAGEDPAGEEGQRIAALHAKWLSYGGQSCTPAKHRGIAELYVLDERFTAYYDRATPGCARFLRDAVAVYAG